MKTISIKQPWAFLICSGVKDIENRTWQTKFRGRVLVHASAKAQSLEVLSEDRWNVLQSQAFDNNTSMKVYETGAIIGSVEIVDCVINHSSIWADKASGHVPFKKEVIYNWIVANPILFPEPLPVKGKLNFWDYPNILAEPEEKDGELFCHCRLSVNERIQVSGDASFGYHCRYCGGKWYK